MCVQTLTLFSCYDSRQKYLPLSVTFCGKFVKVLLKHRFLLIPEALSINNALGKRVIGPRMDGKLIIISSDVWKYPIMDFF